jgi:indolepyruvate ferredoxin oxidoreductase alpha subunit
MTQAKRLLLSGNEAVAWGALHAGVALGTGYPGTPSTEILEAFSELGGKAQWAPNEKVGAEVALGVAFAGSRALVTMKHVGLNVAADPFFTAAYTDLAGGFVVVSADDPGMASSQNEQDNRFYARAAGVPMLEPSDSQEAYRFTRLAFDISERWRLPVLLRLSTRICHSKTVVCLGPDGSPPPEAAFVRNVRGRVMIPAHARVAHVRLSERLAEVLEWNEREGPNERSDGDNALGLIASGISYAHAREASPGASFLKLGMSYPLPLQTLRAFVRQVERCVVVEEGEPYLADALRAAGMPVEAKGDRYRFGELNVDRVRRILAGDASPEPSPRPGKPPQLCPGCPHRGVFGVLRDLQCIVAGDIGCYTLSVLPPFEAMDTCVCMGASIGVGLGLRHVLPEDQARRVVSVIGDSTFMHSGITGLVEMVYNPPPTGHVVLILDNETTAMTGLQEHPGTGRSLDHRPAHRVVYEELARAMGVSRVHVVDPSKDTETLRSMLVEALASDEPTLIVARRPCLLMSRRLRQLEAAETVPSCPAAASKEN